MNLPDAERRSELWDKLSLWIVVVAVFIAILGGVWGLWQTQQTRVLTQTLVTVGNIHHAETAKQNAEITSLLKEHSVNFAQQEAAAKAAAQYDADVKALAQELVADLQAVCAQTGADCPPLTIPGS